MEIVKQLIAIMVKWSLAYYTHFCYHNFKFLFGKDEKSCRIEESHLLFHSWNNPSFCDIAEVTIKKQWKPSLFFWRKLISLHWCSSLLACCCLLRIYVIQLTDKTAFWITSSCLTVFWEKIDGILYPSSTTIWSKR